MKAGGWVNLFLGAWLLVSPFALHLGQPLTQSNLASGVLVVLVALWSIVAKPQHHASGWVMLALAFWVFSAPWALGIVGDSVMLANSGLCGSLIAIFAIVRTLSGPVPAAVSPAS